MWTKIKQFFWETRGVWLTTPTVAGVVILLRFGGLLQSWEWEVYDLYLRSRPLEPRDSRVVIVGIDENDVEQMQDSIIPDRILAELLEKLKAMKPRAIGLDIYRNLPVPPGYSALKQVFNSTPNLIGIEKVAGELGQETVAPPRILAVKGQVGANDMILDADKKVRRGLMYLTRKGKPIYSFSLYLALLYLEKEGISPQMVGETDWQLGKTLFKPLEANDGGYIRTDAKGFQVMINYRGSKRHFEMVSMRDILENRVPSNWGSDRVILVGKVGESFKDDFFTPYSSSLFGLTNPESGVEIHATLTSQIISAALEKRSLMKTWSDSQEWLWILFWSNMGALISWQLRYTEAEKSLTWQRWGSFLLAGGALVGSTYWAFLDSWWLPIVPPLLAFSGSAAVITAYIARKAVSIRKTFGRYLTDQIVAALLENPSGLKMGGERRKITLLTSDLRGFTAMTEQLPPEEVIKILNFYLGTMAEVITKHQGTIDEFMGDGILVLFGAPTAQEDDAKRAIACGVEMQLAMNLVNQQIQSWGFSELDMGIGIHTGEVVVGNIGSEKRTKYGVVGSQVNLTYRIESYTTGGQILISQSTLQEAGEILLIKGEKIVQPKGVRQPITIYEIGGIRGKYNLFLPQEAEVFLPLLEPIPIHYQVLEEKQLGETLFWGSLSKISLKGAEIEIEAEKKQKIPPGLSNIKLNLLNKDDPTQVSEDIYAKVLEKMSQNHSFYIHFTSKNPALEAKINALYALTSQSS